MLRLPAFELHRPRRLAEAVRILADEGPRARPVAGGTDLFPNMKRRHQAAESVVSLLGIEELSGIARAADGTLRLGATTRLDEVASDPLVRAELPALAAAVASISSPPLRNLGTIGGNVCVDTRCTYYDQTEDWRRSIAYCMKEAGEICWVAPSSPRCWAHSASDSAPVLAALGARCRLVATEGERELPIAELFRPDGIDYLAKRRDELLTDLFVPAASAATRCRSAFVKLRRRGSIDFAVLSVAVALWPVGDGPVERAEIWLGAVASAPVRAEQAAAALVGSEVTSELAAEVGRLARRPATPMDNTDFQAQWRGAMVEKLTADAIRRAAGLAPLHPLVA